MVNELLKNKTKSLFGTKAETLGNLKHRLKKSKVPEFFVFTIEDWKNNKEGLSKQAKKKFGGKKVIIRSSACNEDSMTCSKAGYYESILNINVENPKELSNAVCKVIKSYEFGNESSMDEQIIVQQMVENVSMSGVLFTQDLKTGAPYYVINYDDQSGKTDTVTSGGEYSNRTLFVQRSTWRKLSSKRFKKLIRAIIEIEKILLSESLDIEFAIDNQNEVYLLQVRRITTKPNWNRGITININDAIQRITEFVVNKQKPIKGIYGKKSIFGYMPDWNPAEMIGTAPRPLSLSLYKKLITDYAWRIARNAMGYSEPKGAPLMVSMAGKPYIDVRMSFHSLIPQNLNKQLGSKIVNAYIDRLIQNKEFHDKIEFEIAITSLSFDFEYKIKERYQDILSIDEIDAFKSSLFYLTNNQLNENVTPIQLQIEKIKTLDQQRKNVLGKGNSDELISVMALLEDCIYLGTIPFSILARQAFIGREILTSLVYRSVIDDNDISLFMKSIQTVASQFLIDTEKVHNDALSLKKYLKMYGHLRPGTYDILSLRYDQRDRIMFDPNGSDTHHNNDKWNDFSKNQYSDMQKLVNEIGFQTSGKQLIEFIKNAIIAREYAKFIFTKNVSDSLEIISAWGESTGLSRDELSFLNIDDILNSVHCADGRELEQYLRDKSIIGRQKHEITSALKLPHIIEKPEDVSIVPLLIHKANFITNKIIRGEIVYLDGRNHTKNNLNNKIVIIEGADPGFDWIFTTKLKGLVTKYGGVNSHMAIRCAEFDLPAAIGCGEQIFERILQSSALELNCTEERITPLNGI